LENSNQRHTDVGPGFFERKIESKTIIEGDRI
jgi:hypothetical protein